MRAIRQVNPAARLVQTDDLGFCHATAPLQRSADFQNERRWMGWDLLCGKVVPGHALWGRLVACGLEGRLRTIADDPCPPDVIGVNHYLSSERLLDHQIERHGERASADQALGTTDGVVHVDVDAVRTLGKAAIGLAGLVTQAWERYRIPVAITECHLGSTRDEQARWFIDAWQEAEGLRERGVDVRAVTAWSLLGAYDWNRMVTRFVGHYEPGVFDVRGGAPRPTLMSSVLKDLASGQRPLSPALQVPGWWREQRHDRRSYAVGADCLDPVPGPLVIVGDYGVLTALAVDACEARGLPYMLADGIMFGDEVAPTVRSARPWGVVDARMHGSSSENELGGACRRLGINGAFFTEEARCPAQPSAPGLLVVEHGPVFVSGDDTALPVQILDALDADRPLGIEPGSTWGGVYGPSLIDGVLDLLLDGATGHMRFSPAEHWSPAEFARVLADAAGFQTGALPDWANARGALPPGGADHSQLPPTEAVLERFIADRRQIRRASEDALPLGRVELYLEAAE
jgi:dTDP-4-dehydrorhamnose reductase